MAAVRKALLQVARDIQTPTARYPTTGDDGQVRQRYEPMALDLADRVFILGLGRIVLSGLPAELRDSEDIRRAYLGG